MRNSSTGSDFDAKHGPSHIEGHGSEYNEKRSSDDFDTGSDKVHWDARSILALISLCLLWVGSQLPLYYLGGSLSYVAEDIGGMALTAPSWMPVANTLALASVAPFSGYLGDLFGRRNITMIGALAICIGIVIVATAHSFAQVIGGMALSGAGAGIGELTALSGVGELVPVKKRGLYVGLVVAFLIPSTPYVMYSQLFSSRSDPANYQGWRWGQWISLIYNGIALIGIAIFYFPERNSVEARRPRAEVLKEIDYVGAFLSVAGVALFLVALQSGGLTHPWDSAVVLSTLIIGIVLMIAFVVWEWKFAKTPMIPRALFQGQRIVAIAFAISFISGMNFYSLINFFPLTFSSLYNPDPVQVGLKGLGYGMSVTAGAASVNALMTLLPKYNRELLLASCAVMTAFIGALAVATPDNPKLTVALGTIGGFGVGGVLVPAQTVAMTACPDSLIGTVVSLALAIRVIGGSIGYSIYYNVFKNKLTAKLPIMVAEYAIRAGLPAASAANFVGAFLTAPTTITSINGVTPQVIAAATRGSREAYADALYWVWVTSIAFGLSSVFMCLALPSNYKFLTSRVAAHIKH